MLKHLTHFPVALSINARYQRWEFWADGQYNEVGTSATLPGLLFTNANVHIKNALAEGFVGYRLINCDNATSLAIACGALLFGCGTTQTSTQNRESMLVASGFKVITPTTALQQQKLQKLPPSKVTMIQKGGKTYYIFPDPAHNQAYVGRAREYQTYLQMRADKKLARESLETAEMYQDSAMEWSLWGG